MVNHGKDASHPIGGQSKHGASHTPEGSTFQWQGKLSADDMHMQKGTMKEKNNTK